MLKVRYWSQLPKGYKGLAAKVEPWVLGHVTSISFVRYYKGNKRSIKMGEIWQYKDGHIDHYDSWAEPYYNIKDFWAKLYSEVKPFNDTNTLDFIMIEMLAGD